MIVLFRKGATYKMGGALPIVSIPIGAEGEQREFNDFQWWAPTDKWNAWLKSHPRDWQAESETYHEDLKKRLYESLVAEKEIDTKVLDFASFSALLEDEATEGGDSSGVTVASEGEASGDERKRYTKFTLAYNQLKKEGKIKEELNTDDLKKGSEYAIIWELPSDDGTPVPETRSAYKSNIISELPNGVLAKIDEALPFGKLPEDEISASGAIVKVANFGASLLSSGVAIGGALAAGAALTKGAKALSHSKLVKGGFDYLKGLLGKGAASDAAKSATELATAETEGYYSTITGKKLLNGIQGTAKGEATLVKVGEALPKVAGAPEIAAGETALANSLPLAPEAPVVGGILTNPVTWIIAGVLVTGATIQRVVNFTSDAQAPRLGQIEDEGIDAHDAFMPGTIPDGDGITICWTQSSGNGWFADILWNSDTRTTMDLVKLGNFDNKAYFLLIQINSKEYDAILKSKEMILLSFDQNKKFERGFFDNDDLEFEMISVEKGNNIVSTIFQGYCTWEEMSGAYRGADDEFIGVPENAPDEYSFHYKSPEGGRDINVVGKLIKDLSSMESMQKTFDVGSAGGGSSNESESNYTLEIDWERINESSGVLSFSEFSKFPMVTVPTFEDEKAPGAMITKDGEKVNTGDIPEEGGAEGGEGADRKYLTQREEIAAYEVDSIEYADKKYEGQDLPELTTFIVPNNYLEAEYNEKIAIQPIQEVSIVSPRRGTIIVETEPVPPPVPDPKPEDGDKDGEGEGDGDGDKKENQGGGVPVAVSMEDIKLKYKDNPKILNSIGVGDVSKIKDSDKNDKVNILDFVTPEEKKQLGIEDWPYIKKIKIYKNGETGDPYMIKFKGGGTSSDRKRKISSSDPAFSTALKVAERIQVGFKGSNEDEETD